MTVWLISLLGVFIGSFLNVLIYRIPLGEEFVKTRSHCMVCKHVLGPLDLIPVLSFLSTGGKCRYCKTKLSWQYPSIEVLTGVLYGVVAFFYTGTGLELTLMLFVISILIVITIIDFKLQIIPDGLNITLFLAGVVKLILDITTGGEVITLLINSASGFFLGGGLFLLLALVTNAMGGGDIKLVAALGFIVGWQGVLFISVISFVSGAIVMVLLLLLKVVRRGQHVPFGPYIALAGFLYLTWGDTLITWYVNYIIQ